MNHPPSLSIAISGVCVPRPGDALELLMLSAPVPPKNPHQHSEFTCPEILLAKYVPWNLSGSFCSQGLMFLVVMEVVAG